MMSIPVAPQSELLLRRRLRLSGSLSMPSLQHLKHLQMAQLDSLHSDSTRKMRKQRAKNVTQQIVTTGTF